MLHHENNKRLECGLSHHCSDMV